METLLQDIRYGLRSLGKNPAFTAIVAITIALGVGANTATFTIVNGFLIRPLPVPSPERVIALAIQEKDSQLGALGFSFPEFAAFRQQAAGSCEMFGQTFTGPLGLTAEGRTEQVSVVAVTGNYFSGLEVKPALGRLLRPGEGETPGEQAVLILGYSYWQKRFGGNPDIVGTQVRINGRPVEIVGVVPKEFHGMWPSFEMDGYVPLSAAFPATSRINFWTDRNSRGIAVMGRLGVGVSLAQAQSLFDVISRRQADQYPASDKGISVRVIPERLARPVAYANAAFLIISSLFLVLSAIVLVLACTNVANIMMARASARTREMAIRTALGGSRRRLVRQMLTETMLLAGLGGALGVLLGAWISKLASSIHFSNFPLHLDTSFDWVVFAYAFAVVPLAGVFVGLSSALKATGADVNVVLHQGDGRGAGGAGRHKVRRDLMALQVAGSLTLLIIAGLFIRSLRNTEHITLGFDPDHVLNITLDPQMNSYPEAQTKEFYRELLSKAREIPGVESGSLASSVPITSFPSRQTIYREGTPSTGVSLPSILFNRIDSNYFETMRIPVLLGRAFLASDNEAAPAVAIVNQTMAAQFWPGQKPIGKRFSMKGEAGPFLEVVGVARDSKYQTIAEDPQPYFYVPIAQNYTSLRVLQIRSSIAPASLINQVQQQIRALDPAITIVDMRTMNESLEGATGFFIFRLGASLASFIGILGLVLAVLGVYGMVSYAVTRRTQEIGIRVALGADQCQVLRLIVSEGMKVALAGVCAGLLAAWAITRMMSHLLVGVGPSDPLVYVGVSLLVSLVVMLACYIPARRASRVDPMVALRYE